MKVKLSQIKVNPVFDQKYTTREIEEQIESMEMNELQKPISVTRDNSIISGYNRYLVAKFLGWEEIEVIIKNSEQENTQHTTISPENANRKNSVKVLNEIQQLYQNYTKTAENKTDISNTMPNKDNPDTSRHLESWYW